MAEIREVKEEVTEEAEATKEEDSKEEAGQRGWRLEE